MVKECLRLRFFRCACVLCSASWLNCAGVRNLFHFKQDALIAEAQSQITSIHSSESWLIGIHEVQKKGLFFIWMLNIFNDAIISSWICLDIYLSWVFFIIIVALFVFWIVLHFMLTTVVFFSPHLHHAVKGYNGNERIWAVGLFPSLK